MRLFVVGGAAFAMGALAIVYRLMVGATSTRFLLMLLGFPLASAVWVLRPQIVTLFMLVTLVWLLVEERHWPLPIVFVVWANAHGGVSVGGLLLAAVTVVAVVRARRGDATDVRRAVRLCLLAPLCALATALTPLGFQVWHFVGGSLALSRKNRITEWQPTLPTGPFEISFWILAAAFVGLLIWRRGRLRESASSGGLSWGDTVILTAALLTLPLGFLMHRNTAMFLLVAIPAASRLLGPDFRFGRSPSAAGSEEHPRLNLALFVAISLVELVGVLLIWRAPPPRSGWQPMSVGAIEAVRELSGADLQPVLRRRLPDLVRAREAGLHRQPSGSLSFRVHS